MLRDGVRAKATIGVGYVDCEGMSSPYWMERGIANLQRKMCFSVKMMQFGACFSAYKFFYTRDWDIHCSPFGYAPGYKHVNPA